MRDEVNEVQKSLLKMMLERCFRGEPKFPAQVR